MQEGEALEAVALLSHQLPSPHIARCVIRSRKLHHPHGAGGARLDPEGHHALGAVVAGVKAGVGTEGLTLFEHPIEQGDAVGFKGVGIERMGLGRLPKGQQLVAQAHHVGVGDVLEPQVKGIGHSATGLLGAKDAAVHVFAGLLLGQPALGAHKAVAQAHRARAKAQGHDHAVAIKRVMHPLAAPLQPPGPVAVEGARELGWNHATRCRELHCLELHAHVAKGTGPVGPVVTRSNAGGSSH